MNADATMIDSGSVNQRVRRGWSFALAGTLLGLTPWFVPVAVGQAAGPTGSLRRAAAQLDQAGATAEAAATYEEMARREPEQAAVVAPRLVSLYVALGRPDDALRWAQQHAGRTPDPTAYLAGVYTDLGEYDHALRLLRPTLVEPQELQVTLARYWQVADIQMAAGHRQEALATLEAAARLATGSPHEATATRRLSAAGPPSPPPMP
jgi:tetratricopeptide (TPR) repeat protein